MRQPAIAIFVVGTLVLGARSALANVTLVLDPSPQVTGTLVVGDFAETGHGLHETYRFAGQVRDDGGPRRLLVRARANGVVIPESQQSFALATGSNSYTYVFTYLDNPVPGTVGLEFEAPDGPVTAISGLFQAAPGPAVPATTPATLGMLGGALVLLGACASAVRKRRRSQP